MVWVRRRRSRPRSPTSRSPCPTPRGVDVRVGGAPGLPRVVLAELLAEGRIVRERVTQRDDVIGRRVDDAVEFVQVSDRVADARPVDDTDEHEVHLADEDAVELEAPPEDLLARRGVGVRAEAEEELCVVVGCFPASVGPGPGEDDSRRVEAPGAAIDEGGVRGLGLSQADEGEAVRSMRIRRE